MITMMREIVTACDRHVDTVTRCRAHLDYAGIMVTAERRDGTNCAAFLISWEMLTNGKAEEAIHGVEEAARRARKAA